MFLDIETSPIIAAVWSLREADAVWVERDTFLLSFAIMWAGEKKPKTYALPDFPLYKKDRINDRDLMGVLWRVLNDADIVVAHNGQAFDVKKINSRMAVHRLPPPSPYKVVDTLKIARKHFKFDSARLDNLGQYLNEGRKLPHTGAHLWRGCVNGDRKSWALMRQYNSHDVVLLEKIYERLKPWGGIPDLRPYTGLSGCPTCLSSNVQRRGISIARARRYQRFQCRGCGAWFSGQLERAA